MKNAALYLQNNKHSWESDCTGEDFPLLHSTAKEILQTNPEQTKQLNAFHWDYLLQASHHVPNLYHVKYYTSKGHHCSYEH